ncbi:hypothetical protein DVV91_16895 [Clostridium botulinum]|uniref:hypothetical protein n=1 Tax=Clostridium botulinum TaxID=1491 RepID=UPI0019687459|nr:hypothetical protein [Clostridium botulinum]MBN1076000.1 hypothetical protein [Clostridium botulinum]
METYGICEKCGRTVKLYYFEGKGYGSECFKSVAGISYEQNEANLSSEKRIKREKQIKEQFISDNPVIYVCIDKDAYSRKEDLKANKFQFLANWWIGFNIEGLEDLDFLKFDTKKYFEGWGYCYNSKTAYEFAKSYEDDEENLYRDINKELQKRDTKKWIGEEKEKVQINVTLAKITGYATDYGYTHIYIFKDNEGNKLTWKTSKDMDWEEGQEIEIKATIKAHEIYNNEKQTSILRVKEVINEQRIKKAEFIGVVDEQINIKQVEVIEVEEEVDRDGIQGYWYTFKKDNYNLMFFSKKDLQLEIDTFINFKATIKENKTFKREGDISYLTRFKII